MDTLFAAHNTHQIPGVDFQKMDPNLRRLAEYPLVYRFPLLDRLPIGVPGIYSMTGGRQIGKTTVLKQWMAVLLDCGIKPEHVVYYTGELVDDHHALVRLINTTVSEQPEASLVYILFDEITYVKDWDKGIKFLADSGVLDQVVLLLTGSDSLIIQEARARFPGRRGRADIVDFHLFPLTFYETVMLKGISVPVAKEVPLNASLIPSEVRLSLDQAFHDYLLHGGYLRAINDLTEHHQITPATFLTYSDWIRGDMMKRGKQEHFLREVLGAVVARLGSQVTWNNLSKDLSIDHPATVSDYIALLGRMDALFVQPALREDKLVAAPKKARKVMCSDPFIYHAIRSWLNPTGSPFSEQALPAIDDSNTASAIVEACAVTHISRFFPTFYIKSEGEVDIAHLEDGKINPIEVKWSHRQRAKDFKQLAKYERSKIWSRSWEGAQSAGIPIEPLPLALYQLGASPTSAGDWQ